jgi:hypothetical protein
MLLPTVISSMVRGDHERRLKVDVQDVDARKRKYGCRSSRRNMLHDDVLGLALYRIVDSPSALAQFDHNSSSPSPELPPCTPIPFFRLWDTTIGQTHWATNIVSWVPYQVSKIWHSAKAWKIETGASVPHSRTSWLRSSATKVAKS